MNYDWTLPILLLSSGYLARTECRITCDYYNVFRVHLMSNRKATHLSSEGERCQRYILSSLL